MRANLTWLCGLFALALGCGEREPGVDVEPRVLGRARLGDELLFLDASRDEVDALNVMQDVPSATVQRIAMTRGVRWMAERHGGARRSAAGQQTARVPAPDAVIGLPLESSGQAVEEILVLSDGKQDAGGDYIDKPMLTLVDVKHRLRKYPLSVPFSEMLLSHDGRYALLWGQSAAANSDRLLNDPNRVALVDLNSEPSTNNPYERTLKATGGAVTDALVTAPLLVEGEERPIALFSFSNGMNVWDLAHPDHEDITVTVDAASGMGSFRMQRLVPDPKNGKLYLLFSGETVLRVLSFGAKQPGASNDFGLSWNQLSLDSNSATDMVLFNEIASPKVLVAAGGTLRIVDVNNSKVSTAPLSIVGGRLHSFVGSSPKDNDVKQRVLVWGDGGYSVTFVELGNLEKGGTQNIEPLSLGNYVLQSLIPLTGNLLLTVLRGGGIGTLDLDNRRFRPLASQLDLGTPLIESDAHRVWVGGNGQDRRVGFLEPATLAIGSLRLDSIVQQAFLFENGSERRIVATHDSPIGEVTIFDAQLATRKSSKVLSGFLLDGWVSR